MLKDREIIDEVIYEQKEYTAQIF
jgi:hypothetical protein